MLKTNKRTLIITSIIILIPMIIGLSLWNMLPDTLATHFSLSGDADGFSSKALTVIGMPILLLAIQWAAAFIIIHDPKKQNISPKMFSVGLWIIPVISMIVAGAIYPYNLGYKVNMMFIAGLTMGLLFIIVGNYLPKARQNYSIGIKVPWTLANEENWNRTHRLAGYIWVICGILSIVISLTGMLNAVWIVALIIAAAIVPAAYSFWLHTKCGL